MIFTPGGIDGLWLIDLERHEDDRGYFARVWSEEEFSSRGLSTVIDQISLSFNTRPNTVRGLHFQLPPHEEIKLVRCVRGSVYDAVVDLRPDSPTYRRAAGFELSARNGRALYIPGGLAHGFQTLEPDTEILYQMDGGYEPAAARGVRYDDPAFSIEWQDLGPPTVAERDLEWPPYQDGLYPLAGLRDAQA